MNYKDFTLGDWIGHISGVIEDETTLDGNEMRDLIEFLATMQEPKTVVVENATTQQFGNSDKLDCISRQEAIENVAQIAKVVAKSDKQKSLCGRIIYMLEHMREVANDKRRNNHNT